MADTGLDIGSLMFQFVDIVKSALHDMMQAFSDSAQPLILMFLLAIMITLIAGTILTVMYMIQAALSNSRGMKI